VIDVMTTPRTDTADPQGMLEQLSIAGQFLRMYPEFDFSLEEYLISRRYGRYLTSRFHRILRGNQECTETWAGPANMLNQIRGGLYDSIPAYCSASTVANWEGLPLISKRELRLEPQRFLAPHSRSGPVCQTVTSGTSGAAMVISYSAAFYLEALLFSLPKILRRAGLPYGGRPVFSLTINEYRSLRSAVFVDPTASVGLAVMLVMDEQNSVTTDTMLSYINKTQPECVLSMPSVFQRLVERLEEKNDSILNPPMALVSSGSILDESLRSRLQERFRCPVINAYAMAEFGLIASECSNQGVHLENGKLYVEIVDDTGSVLPWGQSGEIVVSMMENRAMPLLRYRTGDAGTLLGDMCGCGSRIPRLSSLLGRKTVCFRLRSGTAFSPLTFNDLFSEFPSLSEFQITQEAMDRYEVLIEVNVSADDGEDTGARLSNYIRSAIPGDPEVVVRTTKFQKNSKFERYRTNC
jgi:phenylacetate-CoA ligase